MGHTIIPEVYQQHSNKLTLQEIKFIEEINRKMTKFVEKNANHKNADNR